MRITWSRIKPQPDALNGACTYWETRTARDAKKTIEGVILRIHGHKDARSVCVFKGKGYPACVYPKGERVYRIHITTDYAQESYLFHEMLHVLLYEQGMPEDRQEAWIWERQ